MKNIHLNTKERIDNIVNSFSEPNKIQRISNEIKEEVCLDKVETIKKSIESGEIQVYTKESIDNFLKELSKSQNSEELEKAKKDLSKLIKKIVVDKNGNKKTVYVKNSDKKSSDKNSDESDEVVSKDLNKIIGMKLYIPSKGRTEEIIDAEIEQKLEGDRFKITFINGNRSSGTDYVTVKKESMKKIMRGESVSGYYIDELKEDKN